MTEMNEVSFSREDIDALTERLGQFATGLSQKEWNLLLAIFEAAANRIQIGADTAQGTFSGGQVKIKENRIDDPTGQTARQLCDQLRKAYVPGKAPAPKKDQVTPPRVLPEPPPSPPPSPST